MKGQAKDQLYDYFLKEPTKENFRRFLQENCGEMDEIDYKEKWIEKGHLAKTILSMANSGGGVIVVGVREEDDGTLIPIGLETFEDKAKINDDIAKYFPASLDYEIFDFNYNASEYEAVKDKKFQMLLVHDTPDRLPFISLKETTDLEKDVIYVRRGTKCEKASASEIEHIISRKMETVFKESSDLSLDEHLIQLKKLYNELPKKIKVLVKKGEPTAMSLFIQQFSSKLGNMWQSNDVYDYQDNPDYPSESYEAFNLRMIDKKKLKIEKVLDLK